MERREGHEMLDRGGWSQAQVDCALGAIRRVNLLYGGDRMHKRLYRRIVSRFNLRRIDILEVAAARGEVIRATANKLRKRGISTGIWLLDRNEQHLPNPSNWHKHLPAPVLLSGDALNIPLEDNSVDVVSCCLFLHHLGPDHAKAYLREALRVSRLAVLVNDVERTRANYICSLLYRFMDPSELSRHDGPTSVRQAFTRDELESMLRETGRPFELRRGPVYRLGAILWKNDAVGQSR